MGEPSADMPTPDVITGGGSGINSRTFGDDIDRGRGVEDRGPDRSTPPGTPVRRGLKPALHP